MKNNLKALRETEDTLVVGNYIVLFGGEDLQGEHFTKSTVLESDYTRTGQLLVDWEHGRGPTQDGDGPDRDDVLGYVNWKSLQIDEKGAWVERVLSRRNQYMQYLEQLIKSGWVGTSTEAVAKGVEIENGEIKAWPLKRDTLTVSPVEPRMLSENVLQAMKALNLYEVETSEENEMNKDEVKALIAEALDGREMPDVEKIVTEALEGQEKPDVKAIVTEAVETAQKAFAKELNETVVNEIGIADKGVNIAKYSNTWKFDNLSPGDHAFMDGVLRAAGKPVSEDSRKALAIKMLGKEGSVEGRLAMKSARMPMKANELNQSTLAGYGDEWVGVEYSTTMWDSIRFETPILGKIPTIEVPQGAESVVIPLASTPPTFYKVAQASAQAANPGAITRTVTTSKMGTANQTISVSKIGAGTYWTGELSEDSLIPFANELRRSIELEGAAVLESLAIDGDTATGATTNINDIAGTPAGNEYWLAANGFRKLALVTNTANSRDGGALTSADFLETIKLMGLAGKNAFDRNKIGFILDAWTHWKSLELDDVKSRDVFNGATIENGVLTGIWGYDVNVSGNMHRANQNATYGLKANADGKIDLDTASNNTKGAILAVRYDQWRLAWKRRITFETVRVPSADATELTALLRVGLQYRDTEASAISYNITL